MKTKIRMKEIREHIINESFPMFMHHKNYFYNNGHISLSTLQNRYTPIKIQNTKDFVLVNIILKIPQKAQNSQSDPGEKQQIQRHHSSDMEINNKTRHGVAERRTQNNGAEQRKQKLASTHLSSRFLTKMPRIEDALFSEWCWQDWIYASRRTKIGLFLSPFTKLNSTLNQGANVKP